MFFPHPQTVTINKRQIDRNGDWTTTVSYRLAGCAISQASKTRAYETQTYEQDTVMGITILFAPTATEQLNQTGYVIGETDTVVTDDGNTWHVWGLPTNFQSPFTNWQPGMQVPLRHFSG
jgi:hypothetical protein